MKKWISAVFLTFLVACIGGNETEKSNVSQWTTTQDYATKAIQNPYSVLGTTNEQARFADSEISSIDQEEVSFADPYATSFQAGCDTYYILLRWGQLNGIDNGFDVRADWTGSVRANVGTLTLLKTIKFDILDYVSPRTDPKEIAFVSHSTSYYDGLRIRYQVCDSDKAALAAGEEATLSFNAPVIPLEKSYTTTQLASLNDLTENLDANQDSFQALSVSQSNLCQGTMQGHWVKVGHHYGVVGGTVIASDGLNIGQVKGVYSNLTGQGRWVAKFIAREGAFVGILEGTYDDHEYSGNIFDSIHGDIGDVAGTYMRNPEEHGVGTYAGTYTLDCDQSCLNQ